MDKNQHHYRKIDELLLIPERFPETGFASFDALLTENDFSEAYKQLDAIALLVNTEYDENFERLDRDTSRFAMGSKYLIEDTDDPILFKNMKTGTSSYRKLTGGRSDHQMLSFHYVSGLYEYLTRSKKDYIIPEKVDLFLKILDAQEKEISKHLLPFLNGIGKKVRYNTSIKVWKHTFESKDRFLLPLHYDRSLFSAIIHTKNSGEEFLRIFPNREGEFLSEVRAKHSSYPLCPSDFPLMFPGWDAKALFGFAPTPHSVEGKVEGPTHRNSYVWFVNTLK